MTCFTGIVSFGFGFFLGGKMLVGMINDYKLRMEHNLSNMMLLNDWLEFLYSGGELTQYFQEHQYNQVMIYGNGYIGKRLCQALAKTEIKVTAIMDKIASSNSEEVIGVDAKIPDADCIVVTPMFYYNEIFAMLREKTEKPIIPIQSIWEDRKVNLGNTAKECDMNE